MHIFVESNKIAAIGLFQGRGLLGNQCSVKERCNKRVSVSYQKWPFYSKVCCMHLHAQTVNCTTKTEQINVSQSRITSNQHAAIQMHPQVSLISDLRLIQSSHLCHREDSIRHTSSAQTFHTLIIKGSCFLSLPMTCELILKEF